MIPAGLRQTVFAALVLARIIAGEAGPVCGPQGEAAVAQVMAARHAEWGWQWGRMPEGVYGSGAPDEASVALAWRLVQGEVAPGPYLFVLSNEDLVKLHITRPPDRRVKCAGGLALNLYRRWPGR